MMSEAPGPLFEAQITDELRQGDVCLDWLVPKWQPHLGQLVADHDGTARRAVVELHGRNGETIPVVLCSHDCDLENPRSRRGIIVAPVVEWPDKDMKSERSLDLISSRVPDGEGRFAHINLFPLNLGSDLGWRVADFSAITSMISPSKFSDRLLKSKRFEMTEEGRRDFRLKLAAFLAREQAPES